MIGDQEAKRRATQDPPSKNEDGAPGMRRRRGTSDRETQSRATQEHRQECLCHQRPEEPRPTGPFHTEVTEKGAQSSQRRVTQDARIAETSDRETGRRGSKERTGPFHTGVTEVGTQSSQRRATRDPPSKNEDGAPGNPGAQARMPVPPKARFQPASESGRYKSSGAARLGPSRCSE